MTIKNEQRTIAFIGAGNMASAIIGGLIESGYPAQAIIACAPTLTHRQKLSEHYGIQHTADNISAVHQADVIVLAVKPQMMAQVCQDLHQHTTFQNKLVISLAAGITMAKLQDWLHCANIIRVMPNTPCLIRQGMSGLVAHPSVSEKDKQFSASLMQAVGEMIWLTKEEKINDIIAVAGSAPAYLFLFMEAMEKEAIQLGFSPEQARFLVEKTTIGSANLVRNLPQYSLAELRQQVTSKGGTTEQAIHVFEQADLSHIVSLAMQAAIKRAQEMESMY